MHYDRKPLQMKHFKSAAIAAFLLASISAGAQELPTKTERPRKPAKLKREIVVQQDFLEFKNRNKDVKTVHWRKGNLMRIEKQDGTTETYNLNDPAQQKKAEALYGVLPPAPPAPPKGVRIVPPVPPTPVNP